jgi:hypothetical protein
VAAAILAVALGTAVLGWRRVWMLSPDAVNYAGAAHALVEGRGLVAPVQYSYFLPGATPPLPAIHVFAPLFPLLLAVPLALGADLPATFACHLVFASLVGGAALLAARRSQGPFAALAFAVAIAWSPAWVGVARQLISEATSVGVELLFLACAGACLRTPRGGAALGALAWLAWLARPNLALLLPAALAAASLEAGLRRALRSPALWTSAASFGALWAATGLAVELATGRPPYAHYGLLPQLLDPRDARLFRAEYPGALAFLGAHAAEVARLVAGAGRDLLAELFLRPTYHYVGWLAVPALAHAALRGGPGRFERRLAALAALGLAAAALGTAGSFAPLRYPLPAVVCLWLAATAALEDAGRRLELAAAARPRLARLARALPLAVVLAIAGAAGRPAALAGAPGWRAIGHAGTLQTGGAFGRSARAFCPRVDADATVAAIDPWTFHLWCGNAALWVPTDLESDAWVDRYLDAVRPAFLVLDGDPAFVALRRSPRLERVASEPPHVLYRVVPPDPRSPRWPAPAPLGRLGQRPPRPSPGRGP